MSNFPVVHIHAQSTYHEPAFIVANRMGLYVLKGAIDEALARGKSTIELTPSDGENYELFIILDDSDWQSDTWRRAALPYTDELTSQCANNQPDIIWPWDRLEG